MLGTIIGDIVGSVYEFKNCRTKEFAPFFHPEARYTDDTVCTIAVATVVPALRGQRGLGSEVCPLDL
jgi:ADP-ribosylglycohydrolase